MATIRKLRDKWQAIVKRSGFPLQSKSFHNKADARKWAREAESALDNGIVITGKGIATAPITAVTASTDAPNTINAHDCPTVADRGGRTTGGPGVAGRTVSMLGTIFERAIRDGIIDKNPVRGVARPKDKPKKPPFSYNLVKRLGEALLAGYEAKLNTSALTSIHLLLLSGCRRQEVLSLRWQEVDFDAQCLRLSDTKSGAQIRPIGKSALDVIRKCERTSGYVFPASSKSGHFVGLPRIWNAVAARAGLQGMTIHGLRHWHASAAAEMNFSELTIAGLLGHSIGGVTARYAVTPDTALISAADQVSQQLSDTLGIKS